MNMPRPIFIALCVKDKWPWYEVAKHGYPKETALWIAGQYGIDKTLVEEGYKEENKCLV